MSFVIAPYILMHASFSNANMWSLLVWNEVKKLLLNAACDSKSDKKKMKRHGRCELLEL